MYGHRGAILAHFGWTWDYLLWGVPYHIVQKMMIDAPGYQYDTKPNTSNGKKESTSMTLTNDNKAEVMAMFNAMQ